jgi:hypothetical protein
MSDEPECPRGTPLDKHKNAHLFHASRADRGRYFDIACVAEEVLVHAPLEGLRQMFRSAWTPPFAENGYIRGLEPIPWQSR